MEYSKVVPKRGDVLVHVFRGRPGEVRARVADVDEDTGRVTVNIGSKTYPSLSAAARAITGHPTNGWIFWGLKKQTPNRPRTGSA